MQKEKKIKILYTVIAALSIAAIVFAFLYVKEKQKAVIVGHWNSDAVEADVAAGDGYYIDEYMQQAIKSALDNEQGGPIGAVITRKNGELVVSACNQNSTANTLRHAEMCAIEEAQRILGTRDLSDCILYTSAEPCLMCASAIANVKMFRVYYAADFKDSESFGFSDEKYYDEIVSGNTLTDWVHVKKDNCLEPFEAWYQRKHSNLPQP